MTEHTHPSGAAEIPCPTCGANAGERCRRWFSRTPHWARARAWFVSVRDR